jgi:hypothetical protein
VLRLTGPEPGDTGTRAGPLRAGLVSLACLLRGLPHLFAAAPGTPLRVLCIVALDTLHVLRRSRPLSPRRRQDLATFLDFQACANAEWDRKPLCATTYQRLRQRVQDAGLGSWMTDYVSRLRELEARRPPVGGDRRHFDEVRAYREAVARLALAAVTAIALDTDGLDEGIRATQGDSDVAALFRIAMQCQIIDDVVDYRQDLSAGLPSFLTASASLPEALAWTADAARAYAASYGSPVAAAVFPLRAALRAVTALARLAAALRLLQSRREHVRSPGRDQAGGVPVHRPKRCGEG